MHHPTPCLGIKMRLFLERPTLLERWLTGCFGGDEVEWTCSEWFRVWYGYGVCSMKNRNEKNVNAKNVNSNPAIDPKLLAIAQALAGMMGTSATAPATEPANAKGANKSANPERSYFAVKFPGGGIIKFSVKDGNIGRLWLDNGNVSLAEFTNALNIKPTASNYERTGK